MRGRTFIYLALIIILGIVAAVVYFMRSGQQVGVAPEGATPTPIVNLVNVVVAVQGVPRGTVITEDLIGLILVPQDILIEGWFTDFYQVLGKRAKFDLDAGALLTRGMLVDTAEELSQTGSNAALVIPRGYVAIAIPISRLSSVAYGIQDGDHVNLIVTLLISDLDAGFQTLLPNWTAVVQAPYLNTETGAAIITAQIMSGGAGSALGRAEFDSILTQQFYVVPSEPQRPRLVSQTLLQDVIVLHVGDFSLGAAQVQTTQAVGAEEVPTPVPQPGQQPAESAAQETPVEPPDIITLIVTPQDAVTLNYLLHTGAQISLVLRSAGDDTQVQTEAVTEQYLLEAHDIPVPAKLPYGLEPRIDELIPLDVKYELLPEIP
ncbi:MAG: SAF domain-containing protein [Chloroflexota bacterium]